MSGNAHASLVRDRAVDRVTMKLAHRLTLVIVSCSATGPNTSLRMTNAPSTTRCASRWLIVVITGCRPVAACAGRAVRSAAAAKANAGAVAARIVVAPLYRSVPLPGTADPNRGAATPRRGDRGANPIVADSAFEDQRSWIPRPNRDIRCHRSGRTAGRPRRHPRGCLALEPEYPAEAAVDVVHEGSSQVPNLRVEVGLVEGHQGGDVNDGVAWQPGCDCGEEDIAGHGGEAGVRGDHGGQGGIEPAGIVGVCLDDQDGPTLGGLAAAGLPEVGPADAASVDHQSSSLASRRRPAATAAGPDLSVPAARSASSTCSVSECEASSSRYLRAARAKNSDRLMPSSTARLVAWSKVSSGSEIAVFTHVV